MKVLNKPIEVISWTKEDGTMTPLKYRVEGEDGELHSYKLKLQAREVIKHTGKDIYKFTCQVQMNNQIKICEIRYNKADMKWTLYKI